MLAEKMGVSAGSIAVKRWKLGIPSWQSRQEFPDKRERYFRDTYGITLEDYDEMLEWQGGGCAICGSPVGDGVGRRLSVDHDHETGEVRGLLCSRCNAGLGMFQDRQDLLLRAVEYLEMEE